MNSIRVIYKEEYPKLLLEMQRVPKRLFVNGIIPSDDYVFLTVIGSRRYTEYGKTVCQKLIQGLSGLPVVIVSGLAYGIDSIAHRTALDNGMRTIAVPGSGLSDEAIHPKAHLDLAKEIVEKGGCLISPFPEKQQATKWTFPVRNPIMAGLSKAILIIEADKESGTMLTANDALAMGRDVLIVPGSIFQSQNTDPLRLMKNGATPITCVEDLLKELGFDPGINDKKYDHSNLSVEEREIVDILYSPMSRENLIEKLGKHPAKVNELLSILELKGVIEEKLGELTLV